MQPLKNRALIESKRLYVATMMQVVGRALEAITQEDERVKKDIASFPEGYVFSMQVLPDGPSLAIEKSADNSFRFLSEKPDAKPNLVIYIKHLEHAFKMLSFQESTAKAFANDRMIVDGEVSDAIRMVRTLNRLEAFILPKIVAELAIKEYPKIPLAEKLSQGAKIYGRVAKSFITQQVKFQ